MPAISPLSTTLYPHPAVPSPGVFGASVTLTPSAAGWRLVYRGNASPGALILPSAVTARTASVDGLWQHTCCELFVGTAGAAAYREFNFSPSGAWAMYAFAAERQRDPAAEALWRTPPSSVCTVDDDGFTLTVDLQAHHLPPRPWQIGLAMVLESRTDDGPVLSYWALHHPSPRPDFHRRASFVLELAADETRT